MLGVLERIVDVESLFTHLRFCKRDVLLSYCASDLTGNCDRAALGFINHFSVFELATLFDRYGFRIACTAPLDGVQMLMRLTPAERLAPVAPCSVAVVSDGSGFAGRLARHKINALLPGEADVHHLTFRTLGEARATTWCCSAPATAFASRSPATTCSTSWRGRRFRSAYSARTPAN
jgi:hypothetical protein